MCRKDTEMESNSLPEEAQLSLLALALLNAIPVATFALWLDYFEQRVAEDRVSREYEHGPDLQLLNAAGITTSLALAIVFFATRPYRIEHPLGSLACFLGAVVFQSWMQARAARRMSPVGVGNSPEETGLGRELKAQLWLAGMITAYLSLTGVLAVLTATLFHTLGSAQALVALAGGAGALAGIMIGLAFIYALAPYSIRRIMNVEEMKPSPLRRMIEDAFSKATLEAPDIYIVKTEDHAAHNLMIAGFPNGKGVFKPAVFVFEGVTRPNREGKELFNEAELKAMILHEVSHANLNHLKKRLIQTCIRLPLALLTGAAIWVLAAKYIPSGAAEIVQFIVSVAVVLEPFASVNRLIRRQEIEADLHAVIEFGADPSAMISALERLDVLNGRNPSIAHGAHPSTAERIAELRTLVLPTPLHAPRADDDTKTDSDQDNKVA